MADAITPKVKAVENMVQRARGATHRTSSPACPVCHVKMSIGVFFDGTGNHRGKDFPKNHSNVAALFDAHVEDLDLASYKLYYEGLGREFNFKDRYEEVMVPSRGGPRKSTRAGYEESDGRMLGLGFADGITERLEKAVFEVTDQIQRQRGLSRVDEINISVFGFSRGATEARAFVNWLAKHSKVQASGASLRFDGVPLNIKFLGLFDTVESVGMAGTNKLPDLIKTKVPLFVQKCTHIVAAHELRDAFPLTIVEGPHRCVVYPGAHADIGGGYTNGEQGRSSSLSRIALLQMLDEARGAGVKLLSVGEMQRTEEWERLYKPSFDVSKESLAALNKYVKAVNPKGMLSEHFKAHMEPYWRWIDSGLAIADVAAKRLQYKADHTRQAEFRRMHHMLSFRARTDEGKGVKTVSNASLLLPQVQDFFSQYVHDSFEHFSATGGTLQNDLSVADYYHLRETRRPS